MKLIIAIMRDQDTEPVVQALITAGLRVTRIASTGGFLKRGSSTIMIGLDEAQIDGALQVINNSMSPSDDPATTRATLFILDVADFNQI